MNGVLGDTTSGPAAVFAALAALRPAARPPDWLRQAALPQLSAGGQPIDRELLVRLLLALRKDTLTREHALPQLVRAHVEPTTRRELIGALFTVCEAKHLPSQWALNVLRLLGDEAEVGELRARILTWRKQGRYSRVRQGLACLTGIGDGPALRALNGLAQQEHYASLRDQASAQLEVVASARQLTRPQLEDQIVPRFGLDDRQMAIELGERQLTLALSDETRPVLRDQRGRIWRTLPRPRQTDHPEHIAAARAAWAALRTSVIAEVRAQAARLEQAMVEGRQWSPADWSRAILGHPLLAALARRVVWAVYDAHGQMLDVFCLGDDLSASNGQYAPIDPLAYAAIGIPHPALADAAQRAHWADLQHDFELISLFPQAGRPVFYPAASEADAITRFARIPLRPGTVRQLHQCHWRSGGYLDRDGAATFFSLRRFASAGITAVARTSSQVDGGRRRVEYCQECFFRAGLLTRFREDDTPRIALSAVPPVVLSEAIGDWSALVTSRSYHCEE